MGLFRRSKVAGSADLSVATYAPVYPPPTPPGGHVIYSRSPMFGHLVVPGETIRSRAPVVTRKPSRLGINFLYSYGGWKIGKLLKPPLSGPTSGNVQSSVFQPWMSKLTAWSFYNGLYGVGYPRNLGFSFLAPQLPTRVDGPGPSKGMQPKSIFTKVQTIPRYGTAAPTYPTQSASH